MQVHTRLNLKSGLLTLLALAMLLGGCNSETAESSTATVANPTVEGPVTGGLLGGPFVSATMFPLSLVGYSQEEYFLTGSATGYDSATPLTSDGLWTARSASTASYKTRMVVYKPVDAAKFNGTVIVEWLNVSGGLDTAPGWIMAHNELIRSGYIWVGVSAQKEGIDGGGSFSVVNLPLKLIDPFRYASLVHPGNTYSYDMFSQAAQALRHPKAIDPLGGLQIKALIAAGESQSAYRMTTYINAIAPLSRLFDGFMVHSRPFSSAPLAEPPQASIQAPEIVHVRSDVGPVLTLQTESDLFLLKYYSSRQPDGSNFRLWEMAGTSHGDAYTLAGLLDLGINPQLASVSENSAPMPGIIDCAKPVNAGPQHFIVSAAYAALNRWVTTGVAPASAPRLNVSGDPSAFVTDTHGNTLGGIRTPYVDVPTATLSATGQPGSMETLSNNSESFCFLFGTTTLFDSTKLKSLYPTHDSYVAAVNAATDSAVTQGYVLPADAWLIKWAAQLSTVGN